MVRCASVHRVPGFQSRDRYRERLKLLYSKLAVIDIACPGEYGFEASVRDLDPYDYTTHRTLLFLLLQRRVGVYQKPGARGTGNEGFEHEGKAAL